MSNENYKKCFKYFYENYKKQVEDIMPNNITAVLDKVDSMGFKTAESDDWISFKGKSIGKFTKDIEKIKIQISANEYVNMLKELLS